MELTQEHVSKLETEFWGAENGGEQESQPTPSEPQQEKTEGDTPPKENDWYKNFGWESEELAKTEIDKLKSIKQPEFKNEESKQLYEAVLSNDRKAVISFLQEQEKLENIITGEVTKDNAADIIKLVMKDKYKELSDKEIDKKFDKIYPSIKKPEQKEDEYDDEYQERLKDWEEKVSEIEAELLMDAKIERKNIEKIKTELALPNINSESAKEVSQEDLTKLKTAFLEAADKAVSDFAGFKVDVKDDDINYAVNYTLSKEEKDVINESLKNFAEGNLDANAIFAARWVKEDQTLNVQQMVKDLSKIFSEEKDYQKMVMDAANQRLELFLKDKKQIEFSKEKGVPMGVDARNESQRLQEAYWGG